ncbi:MAG: heparinase II/III family protein, partial [Pirellulales bacterium]|nr:heparinase II/III family protein [Pirellulales bacterium]
TGDEKYAERAAFFFDILASIYPESTAGSWDYPSSPPSGRFARPWYQVSRNLVVFVEAYELVQASPALEKPSRRPALEAAFPKGPTAQQRAVQTPDAKGLSRPGMTRRENIERNLMQDAAYYCYSHTFSGKLHNGHADYLRGALAVGSLLGISEYVHHAMESPYSIHAMLANNCDRDGRYYETALGYAMHTRDLYLTFVEPLKYWRSSEYPQGIDLFSDPRMRSLYWLPDAVLSVAGHAPNFGDCAPDNRQAFATQAPWSRHDVAFAERLYTAGSSGQKEQFAALLKLVCGGDVDRAREDSSIRRWLLYHADAVPESAKGSLDDDFRRRVFGSWFLGQKGIAILRDGQGPDAQGMLLRYGPSLNHGDFDDLGLLYYGKGWQLTYEIGYGLASTHTQVGWASQTVSHALVTINEASQRGGSGGSLHLFADLPGVKLVEADSPLSYASQGVDQYRRTVALVGNGKDQYGIDLFRVRGGRQHDYGIGVQSRDFVVGGTELGPVEDGSLAGTEHAWGEKIGPDGDILGHPNRPYWLAPPGNGYGFFYDMRRARPGGPCYADWSLGGTNQARFRVHLLPEPQTEIILADAPGLYPRSAGASYLLARRQGNDLASNFAAVMEPYAAEDTSGPAGEPKPVLAITERIDVEGGGRDMAPLGVHVRRLGRDEYFFSADAEDAEKKAQTTFGEVRWRGASLLLSGSEGKPGSLATVGAWDVRIAGKPVGPKQGILRGAVVELDYDQNWIEIDFPLPQGDWAGAAVSFHNPGYSRNTAYRIYGVQPAARGTRIALGPQPMLLGQGRVHHAEAKQILSDIPHEYAKSVVGANNTRFFDGKLVHNQSGAATRISSVEFDVPMKLHVEDAEGFQVGDTLRYYDVQKGDAAAVVVTWQGGIE